MDILHEMLVICNKALINGEADPTECLSEIRDLLQSNGLFAIQLAAQRDLRKQVRALWEGGPLEDYGDNHEGEVLALAKAIGYDKEDVDEALVNGKFFDDTEEKDEEE